jgi:hypothetical protein
MLTTLRNRVVDPDGIVYPWTSPAGKPMQIAAAAPIWAWTDLAYSLLPNGRTLDYAVNNAYRGPLGGAPFGVSKLSFVAGLYALGAALSVYAPPGNDPDLDTWNVLIDAGEPYLDATAAPIANAVINYRSGYYWLDPAVEPAPTLFNSGWVDDIFPVSEPVRWIQRAKFLHPGLVAELVASDYGHSARERRRRGVCEEHGARVVRPLGVGPLPGPDVRVRTQSCGEPGCLVRSGQLARPRAGRGAVPVRNRRHCAVDRRTEPASAQSFDLDRGRRRVRAPRTRPSPAPWCSISRRRARAATALDRRP